MLTGAEGLVETGEMLKLGGLVLPKAGIYSASSGLHVAYERVRGSAADIR